METKRTHPLIITAAVAVILASGIAIASMTGLLPNSQANMNNEEIALQEEEARLQDEALKAEEEAKQQAAAKEQAAVKKAASKPAAAKPQAAQAVETAAVCNNCGRVVEIRQRTIQGEGSGIGAVAGGVVGGLLGNQIGGGNGKKVATAAGVVGGAMLGNKIEKDRKATTQYDVVVEYDTGGSDVFSFSSAPGWQSGDRVRVVNGQLTSSL